MRRETTNGSQQEKSKSRDENHCWVKGKKIEM